MTSEISAFLGLRRIAIIGVSHQPNHFSRMVYRAWRDRKFDVVPVNPTAPHIEGAVCYPRPQDIDAPVDAALVMTPAAQAEQVVQDCLAAGIRRIWLYRRSPAAENLCAKADAACISGECPMMYLADNSFIHRLHRWFHDR